MPEGPRVLVVGAGPAGLATALELTRHGGHPLVVDSNAQPGGLARTIWKDGYGFDLGPHRFFTKSDEINQLWAEILGSDLLVVDRQTRIFYRGKYFSYPLRPFEALSKLGLVTSVRAVWSYVSSRIRNRKTEPRNFEEWVINEFGKVLYEIFFKSYTEKVWGVPCAEIGKEWAGQRIRGLNLASAIKDGFRRGGDAQVRSLVDHFYYPRRGAGQFYDRMKSTIEGKGGEVRLSSTVIEANHDGERITSVVCEPGDVSTPIDHIFVSAPITRWVESLNPPPPSEILSASRSLTYRSHITVNLLIEGSPPFDDNWIYVHAPDLQMARVANYRSFSPDMAPGSEASPLSVEYFCFESDELWTKSDDGLIQLATRELELAGLLPPDRVMSGSVVREADSYPTYYLGHDAHFETLRGYLERFTNLTLIGRAGMYRYNNQDHALMTGLYAARNQLGLTNLDLYSINTEDAYLEETTKTP